tara:strand:+ start:79 stop:585 length:507 start_codon:yes stop_codon:yes gene_type:complete
MKVVIYGESTLQPLTVLDVGWEALETGEWRYPLPPRLPELIATEAVVSNEPDVIRCVTITFEKIKFHHLGRKAKHWIGRTADETLVQQLPAAFLSGQIDTARNTFGYDAGFDRAVHKLKFRDFSGHRRGFHQVIRCLRVIAGTPSSYIAQREAHVAIEIMKDFENDRI